MTYMIKVVVVQLGILSLTVAKTRHSVIPDY